MVRGQWASLARTPGVTPLLFIEGHPGIFNDHRESGPRFNISSEGRIIKKHVVYLAPFSHNQLSPLGRARAVLLTLCYLMVSLLAHGVLEDH